eukprot:m.321233 g.321233  ORF g.321233 m.321233 type:complete len:90 (+) comp15996_c1_seq6:1377-1646(+)
MQRRVQENDPVISIFPDARRLRQHQRSAHPQQTEQADEGSLQATNTNAVDDELYDTEAACALIGVDAMADLPTPGEKETLHVSSVFHLG